MLCEKCERTILTKSAGNKIMENENLRGYQEDPDLIEGHGAFPICLCTKKSKCEDNIMWSARVEMQGNLKSDEGTQRNYRNEKFV